MTELSYNIQKDSNREKTKAKGRHIWARIQSISYTRKKKKPDYEARGIIDKSNFSLAAM